MCYRAEMAGEEESQGRGDGVGAGPKKGETEGGWANRASGEKRPGGPREKEGRRAGPKRKIGLSLIIVVLCL